MIKVIAARFHLGVQLGADVRTGLDSKIHEAEMELNPVEGLYVTKIKNKNLPNPIFVPLGMINMAYLDRASWADHMTPKETKKK